MQPTSRLLHLMGTRIETKIWHAQPEPILDQVEELLYLYQNRFSAHDLTSELMEVNLNAGVQAVPVAADLYALIALGKEHSLPEDSFLNIAIGPLVQSWRIGFQEAGRPTEERLAQVLQLIDPQAIDLDPQEQMVYLGKEGMALDLGALAKGYVADQIVAFLQAMGVASGYINLGGNALVFGPAPVRESGLWQVGLQNPKAARGSFLARLLVGEGSLVTSGTYERVLRLDGQDYHHILDSHTGYPVQSDVASLTIVSKESVLGEVWTSRLFGHPISHIFASLESLPDLEAIVIDRDNQIYASRSLSGSLLTDQAVVWMGAADSAQLERFEPALAVQQEMDTCAGASQGGFGHRQWTDVYTGASAL